MKPWAPVEEKMTNIWNKQEYQAHFVLQMKKTNAAEKITLVNGSLSGLMVHPKVILDRGWGNYSFLKNICTFLNNHDF